MTATFTLTGDLVALVGSAVTRTAYVELDRAVEDVTNDVTYAMKGSTPVESVFTLTGLPAKNALNNANGDFNFLITIGVRKWLVPAQSDASTHDLTEFAETTGLVPVDWSAATSAAASAAAAAASAASVNREQANGVAGLDGSAKLIEARFPTRLADATMDAKYLVKGQTASANSVYVATTGNDTTGTGLSAGSPWLTFQKAFDHLASVGPSLQGQWNVVAAAGTYNLTVDQWISVSSENPIIVRGPTVSGGVPTCIIDGGGNAAGALVPSQQYVHGLRADEGTNIEFRDIKAVDFHAGVGDTTRIAFTGEPGSRVYLNNCHTVGCSWTGGYGFATGRFYVNGGIYDGNRLGLSSNDSQVSIVGGTVIKNSTEAGAHWSRGSHGHLDDAILEDNAIGLLVETNSRVSHVGCNFKRNDYGIRARTGGIAGDGGGNNFNVGGADAQIQADVDYRAFSGESTELDISYSTTVAAVDRVTHTSTGTTSEVTLSSPYTIPARRLASAGRQCRVHVKGIFTASTAASIVTVNYGGMTLPLTVPAAGTNVAFEVDVDLMEVTGGWRSIGKIAQGLNLCRYATASTGFLPNSAQAITVKCTMANSADTINVYRVIVYLTG